MAPAVRRTVDLLFYVNPMDRFMMPPESLYQSEHLAPLEWRSVSFVHAFFSCVLYAAPGAPTIFRDSAGHCYAMHLSKWLEQH